MILSFVSRMPSTPIPQNPLPLRLLIVAGGANKGPKGLPDGFIRPGNGLFELFGGHNLNLKIIVNLTASFYEEI